MNLTTGYLLNRASDKFENKEAFVSENKRITFLEYNMQSNKAANALIRLGIRKNDKVSILLPNSIEYPIWLLGIHRAGAVSVPLNYRLKAAELQYIVEQSESKIVIYDYQFQEIVDRLRMLLNNVFFVCIRTDDSTLNSSELINKESSQCPNVPITEEDPATILYTSGTTKGKPKGAVLTHKNHVWACVSLVVDSRTQHDDILLINTPYFHTGALHRIFLACFLGCKNVIMDKFVPERYLELIEKEKVTQAGLVPTMFTMLKPVLEVSRFNVESLRGLLTGAAMAHVELVKEMIQAFPNARIQNGYGATECYTASILQSEDLFRKIGSVGKPTTNSEVRLVNDDGRDVEIGEIGEICVRGPCVVKEYYNDIEASNEAFFNGWFKSGDLGRFDEDGFLYIVDRKKDIIISGGENISSIEIEDVLYGFRGINEVAVIGIPDPLWGESVMAIIVPKEGVRITEHEIIRYCESKLGRYKRPKRVVFVESIPKTATNKIDKKALRDKYW